jgi:predicted acyltransferase
MTVAMNNSDKISPVSGKGRLLSLDALRGFDMLWIAGGGSVVTVFAKLSGADWLASLAKQMNHVPWEGFHFWDLIFPLFMFISGIAIPLSVKSALSKNETKKNLFLRVLKRMIILVLLGILYNGVFRDGFENARYASILGQIGIAYFFASVIFIFSKSFKANLYWLAGILIGVSILQLFVPVPGIGAGVFTPEGCINGYIDRLYLPGRLAYGAEGMMSSGNGIYDALGLLSIVSAIGITIMGIIAGKILQNSTFTEYRKTGFLAGIGLVLIFLGLIISPFYPIIKVCWTTTYNLLAGGISFLLIALFYLVIDVWRFHKWSFFFRVIGMNSIFIYLLGRIVPVETITGYFIGWIIKPAGNLGELIGVIGFLTAEWLLLYFMYRKKIFIKV